VGISAGQHQRFRHPHSETIGHIQSTKRASIFATNICTRCILETAPNRELHIWYDDFIESNKPGRRNTVAAPSDDVIQAVTDRVRYTEAEADPEEVGLLGYLFEFSEKQSDPVFVRSALSRKIKKYKCSYENHDIKLSPCYETRG
jgi:hypothetical protein